MGGHQQDNPSSRRLAAQGRSKLSDTCGCMQGICSDGHGQVVIFDQYRSRWLISPPTNIIHVGGVCASSVVPTGIAMAIVFGSIQSCG